MALIVVERSFEQSTPFERLAAMELAVADCLRRYRVRPLYSYHARDQCNTVCIYEAPDADAVRATQDEGGLAYERAWNARMIPVNEEKLPQGYQRVIVQRELSSRLDEQGVSGIHARTASCMNIYRVKPIVTYLSADGSRTVCLFTAPDAESARLASVHAGVPLVRAWSAIFHE